MRPSFEIAPIEYGSWTAVTSGAFDAFSTLSITAALFSASVSFSPSGAANTTRAEPPPASGNFSSSRSCATCDSVPGTENSLLVLPLNALALAITATRTSSQPTITLRRFSKAQPPIR